MMKQFTALGLALLLGFAVVTLGGQNAYILGASRTSGGASCSGTDYDLHQTSTSNRTFQIGQCRVFKITGVTTGVPAQSLTWWANTSGNSGYNWNMVVFDDDGTGTGPGALVAQTGSITATISSHTERVEAFGSSGNISTSTVWVGACGESLTFPGFYAGTSPAGVEVHNTMQDCGTAPTQCWSDMSGGWYATGESGNTWNLRGKFTTCE